MEMKLDTYVGKLFTLLLVSFSAIVHILISEITVLLSGFSRALLSLFRADSVIFLGLHIVRFFFVSHAGNVRFLRMCHEKERRRQQYLLTRSQKNIFFGHRTVVLRVKIV